MPGHDPEFLVQWFTGSLLSAKNFPSSRKVVEWFDGCYLLYPLVGDVKSLSARARARASLVM